MPCPGRPFPAPRRLVLKLLARGTEPWATSITPHRPAAVSGEERCPSAAVPTHRRGPRPRGRSCPRAGWSSASHAEPPRSLSLSLTCCCGESQENNMRCNNFSIVSSPSTIVPLN